jgi:hypothetical protein
LKEGKRLLHLRGHNLNLRQILPELHSVFESHSWVAALLLPFSPIEIKRNGTQLA